MKQVCEAILESGLSRRILHYDKDLDFECWKAKRPRLRLKIPLEKASNRLYYLCWFTNLSVITTEAAHENEGYTNTDKVTVGYYP